jgi:hypothetical protein
MKKLIFVIMVSCLPGISLLQAQQVISSGGGYAAAGGVSLAWTIGEPVIATFTGGSYILTQGFHQTRLGTTSIDEIPVPGLTMTVYPNPFSYLLHLRIDEGDFSKLQYSLMDIRGKTLVSEKITKDQTDINMLTFAAGNYLLQVRNRSGELVKSFKVIKYQ